MSQLEINQWEIENKEKIIRWTKDFQENSILFELKDGSEVKFLIENGSNTN